MGNLKFEGCPKLSERNHDYNLFLSLQEDQKLSWFQEEEKSCEIDFRGKYSWHEAGNLKPVQSDEKESPTKFNDESCSI